MQIHNVSLSFKANRNYIHGTDLFNELLSYFTEKNLTNINYTIHKLIENNHGHIYIADTAEEFKYLLPISNATIRLCADEKMHWVAFLFADEPPINSIRYMYDENNLIKLCRFGEKTIVLHEGSPFTFIETIVAMHKQLLQTLHPNAGKWLFTKLILTSYPVSGKTISISYRHNFNFKLVKSSILIDGELMGEIYFSLLAE